MKLIKPGLILILPFFLTACSLFKSTPNTALTPSQDALFRVPQNKPFEASFLHWKGTPYQYGGTTKKGIDCSALVQNVYWEAKQKALPRTTADQSTLGVRVNSSEAKSGDLIFFRTSAKSRHVGIYLEDKQFMHASTSKGVIISRMDNPYWASVFWQVRRID